MISVDETDRIQETWCEIHKNNAQTLMTGFHTAFVIFDRCGYKFTIVRYMCYIICLDKKMAGGIIQVQPKRIRVDLY